MSIEARFQLPRSGGFALDVAFTAPARGVTALFGPSGSGKTTVLRCMAGLQRAEGLLRIGEQSWQDAQRFLPPHARSVGYVFQEASLFPHMNVQANLLYSLKARGVRKPSGLDDIIELLGIGQLLARRPQSLSGGERQRVAIARALASQPNLLLMDEPLAALDHAAKATILPYLERLHRELELPVIYVSHDPQEVSRFADHLVLLKQGKVTANGPMRELLTELHLPMAEQANASAMLEGTVEAHDHQYHLTSIRCGSQRLLVPREDLPPGQLTRVLIHARDVSIALQHHNDSSILNVLSAQVLETRDINPTQQLVKLQLEDGQVLLARITRRSGDALQLGPGKPVYAQVKSVALLD